MTMVPFSKHLLWFVEPFWNHSTLQCKSFGELCSDTKNVYLAFVHPVCVVTEANSCIHLSLTSFKGIPLSLSKNHLNYEHMQQ